MYRLFAVLVVIPFVAVCQQQPEQAASTEEAAVSTEADRDAILAVSALERASYTSGTPDVSFMTEDVVIMPPGENIVVGREAAQAWANAFTAAVRIDELTYTDSDIIVSGDVAIERYIGTATLTPADGETIVEPVKGIHIYERQADGSWKMSQDVWNFDIALVE